MTFFILIKKSGGIFKIQNLITEIFLLMGIKAIIKLWILNLFNYTYYYMIEMFCL